MNNVLYLNKEIYNKSNLQIAIRDYSNITKIEVKEVHGYYSCTFRDCKFDAGITILEFENYLIGITRKNDY